MLEYHIIVQYFIHVPASLTLFSQYAEEKHLLNILQC